MVLIGIHSSRKIRSERDYYVAGKRGNLWQITGSLLATILGSSAILGTADLALTQGWAASWLLLSASAGLFLLVPVSMVVRRQGKYTLPQMIGDFYGIEAKMISSFIISFAWIGIVAAQIIGAAKILNGFTGLGYSIGVWGSGAVFIFYSNFTISEINQCRKAEYLSDTRFISRKTHLLRLKVHKIVA